MAFSCCARRRHVGAVVDFEIRDVNPAAARLLRADPAQLIGRRLVATIPRPFIGHLREVRRRDDRARPRWRKCGSIAASSPPVGSTIMPYPRAPASRSRSAISPFASARRVRLRRATLTDELTQLYNRRGFLSMAEQQLRVARRQVKDAVLMYIDMDDFKTSTTEYGHAEGDRALTAVGRLLRRAVRECDVVARLGGDEFTIMALDADRTAARLIQKRIEERVALLNASGQLAAPLSLTIGHTRVRPNDQAPLPELLARADALLYARKRRRKLTENAHASARRPRAPRQARRSRRRQWWYRPMWRPSREHGPRRGRTCDTRRHVSVLPDSRRWRTPDATAAT